jgi:hypothetical protein
VPAVSTAADHVSPLLLEKLAPPPNYIDQHGARRPTTCSWSRRGAGARDQQSGRNIINFGKMKTIWVQSNMNLTAQNQKNDACMHQGTKTHTHYLTYQTRTIMNPKPKKKWSWNNGPNDLERKTIHVF